LWGLALDGFYKKPKRLEKNQNLENVKSADKHEMVGQ